MRRRFPKVNQQQNTAAMQALVDHKAATLQVILSQIPEKNSTFLEIADLIGFSYEWVRGRLMKNPDRLYRFGTRYPVPKGVAEEFVRSIFV